MRAEIYLFQVWLSIDLVFVRVVEVGVDSVLDVARKSLGFSVSIELSWFMSGRSI